jgi:ectoine hydroxylase-related dioxygenase (phytanoyl-CoA dioxygenase family)
MFIYPRSFYHRHAPAPLYSTSVLIMPLVLIVVLLTLTLAASQHAATALLVSPALTSAKSRAVSPLICWMTEQDDPAFILEKEYELTEQLVAERGAVEELLMANSPTAPLLPNNEPAATAAKIVKKGFGGFGSASAAAAKKKKGKEKKRSNSNKDVVQKPNQLAHQEAAKSHAKVLTNEGLVRIDNILSDSVSDALRDFVYGIRTTEENKMLNKAKQATFQTIRRWDLSIPLFEYDNNGVVTNTPTITYEALTDVLQTTVVGETMKSFLGTDQSELYELSSYISDPGSTRQVIHVDTPCFGTNDKLQPILCTCFIALQDVRMDMGPTVWLPRTNTRAMHDLFFGEEDEGMTDTPIKDHFLQTHESVVGVIPKGSCVLFDSRLLHCGTANKSSNDGNGGSSRALLFFSFKHPNIQLENPGGDEASIRPDLKGRFRLFDFL